MKNNTNPEKLIVNSIIIDAKEICTQFNTYFSTIGLSLVDEIEEKYHKCQTSVLESVSTQDLELCELTPTTTDEITRIIDNLDPNTGCGIDGIITKAVKCAYKVSEQMYGERYVSKNCQNLS